LSRPVRFALVGGGPGSFIGAVHRMGAMLDGRLDLVAGCFSSDFEKSKQAAWSYGVAPERTYPDFQTMFAAEKARGENGIEAVAITTPNHLHLPVALAALKAGIHVISDKPATATLDEALLLREAVDQSGLIYALTYTYTGYPMIRLARAMIARGDYGAVRKVVVEYPQGWLAQRVEDSGNKQAQWRADPMRSGKGGCIGDIGVHAFQLAEYVSGLQVDRFVADLNATLPGRLLDDDCNILLRFVEGQTGVLVASQISTGESNNLTLRIYCEKAGVVWRHDRPDLLEVMLPDGETRLLRAGAASGAAVRLPAGHPEGFIEAFATIYRDFAASIRGQAAPDLVGIKDGVRSMLFVDSAVDASHRRAGWTSLEELAS